MGSSHQQYRRRADGERSESIHDMSLRIQQLLTSQLTTLDARTLEAIIDLAHRMAKLAASSQDSEAAETARMIALVATVGMVHRYGDRAHLGAKLNALCAKAFETRATALLHETRVG